MTEALTRGAWSVIPVTLCVALLCRYIRHAATRHALWLVVLAWFLAPLVLPDFGLSLPAPAFVATTPGEPEISDPTPADRIPSPALPTPAPTPAPMLALGADPRPVDETRFVAIPTARRQSQSRPTETAPTARPTPARRHKQQSRPALARSEAPRAQANLASDGHPASSSSSTSPAQPTPSPSHSNDSFASATPAVERPPVALPTAAPSSAAPLAGALRPVPPTIAPSADELEPARPANAGTTTPALDAVRLAERPRTWLEFAAASLSPWLAPIVAARNALAKLPSFPPYVWIVGFAALILSQAFAIGRFRRRLANAHPAPRSVVNSVSEIAQALSLRRIPETIIVEANVSPMIWCGRTTRLVLPFRLWNQLDKTGRNAILCHELAHLKRRDHWVCRLQSIVFALFWWHPVAWWMCRRLEEEADLSCDAWVTWLMPRARKAYAQAILQTRTFLEAGAASPPAGAIGVISPRARSLARRLTMVMKQDGKPNASLAGGALVASLMLVGWVAMPARSCPPGAAQNDAAPAKVVVLGQAKVAGKADAERAAQEAGDEESYAGYMKRSGGSGQGGDDEHDKAAHKLRAEMLEIRAKMQALREKMEEAKADGRTDDLSRLGAEMGALGGKMGQLGGQLGRAGQERAERHARSSAHAHGGHAGHAPIPPVPPMPPMAALAPMPPMPPMPSAPPTAWAGQWPGSLNTTEATEARVYRLSGGKLEDLTALMVRDDVPIRVRKVEAGLEVHATPRQHELFAAFVALLRDENDTKSSTYRLSEGKREALKKLLSRDDVKVLVQTSQPDLTVEANAMQHAAISGLLRIIDGGAAGTALRLRERASAEKVRERVAPRVRDRMKHMAEQVRAHAADARRQRDEMDQQSHQLEAELERLRLQIDRMQREVEAAREQAENAARQRRGQLEKGAERLESELDGLEGRARQVERRHNRLIRNAERLAEEAEVWARQDAAIEHGMAALDPMESAELELSERTLRELNRAIEREFARAALSFESDQPELLESALQGMSEHWQEALAAQQEQIAIAATDLADSVAEQAAEAEAAAAEAADAAENAAAEAAKAAEEAADAESEDADADEEADTPEAAVAPAATSVVTGTTVPTPVAAPIAVRTGAAVPVAVSPAAPIAIMPRPVVVAPARIFAPAAAVPAFPTPVAQPEPRTAPAPARAPVPTPAPAAPFAAPTPLPVP